MIRPLLPDDTPAIVALAAGTGVFKPLEIETLQELLDDYHAAEKDHGHVAVGALDLPPGGVDAEIAGFAYYAPTPMTDRTWHLYWIAIASSHQGRGLGRRLMEYVEEDIRHRGGRLLVVETSATEPYRKTRDFYDRIGYRQAVEIPDFYADGDGMTIFTKRLLPTRPGEPRPMSRTA